LGFPSTTAANKEVTWRKVFPSTIKSLVAIFESKSSTRSLSLAPVSSVSYFTYFFWDVSSDTSLSIGLLVDMMDPVNNYIEVET
jgi:hypothetical protein